MKNLFLLLAAWVIACHPPMKEQTQVVESPITLNKWLEKVCTRKNISDGLLMTYEFDTSALDLIQQYYALDTAFKENEKKLLENSSIHPFLQGSKHDLDRDGKDEIICFIGNIYSWSAFMIFSLNQEGNYEKIFEDRLWLHNEYPSLKFLEHAFGGPTLVRTGKFYYRGSGHWLFAYQYYAKLGNEIKLALETPCRANDHMNFDYINTIADMVYDSVLSQNTLQLAYTYESSASYVLHEELGIAFDIEYPLPIWRDSMMKIDLEWNENTRKYDSSIPSIVETLLHIENDTLQWRLIRAMKPSLDERAKRFLKKVLPD